MIKSQLMKTELNTSALRKSILIALLSDVSPFSTNMGYLFFQLHVHVMIFQLIPIFAV